MVLALPSVVLTALPPADAEAAEPESGDIETIAGLPATPG